MLSVFALSAVVGSLVNLYCFAPCKWRSRRLTLFCESSVDAARSRASSFCCVGNIRSGVRQPLKFTKNSSAPFVLFMVE